jgi:hypothetical protein
MTLKAMAVFVLMLCAGFATAQTGPTADAHDGSSVANAVVITASTEREGVSAEYHWIADRFPGYKRDKQALLHDNDRFYDEIDITTASGEPAKIYFDITNFFGKM